MDMSLTNWSYGHFCDFLAKIWLPWQRPLDPCNQKLCSLDWSTTKTPVMSNCILVISRRSAFICNYSNFYPKIGCHGNAPLSLVYSSVTDEFPDSTNPISKPNSAWICCIQLKLWQFLWNFSLFWPKFGPMATSLDPCNQKWLLWIGRPDNPLL